MKQVQKTIVIIDGFNLYFGLKSLNTPRYKWLDIVKLANNIQKGHQKLQKVYYCTARVKENSSKHKRQNTYIEALMSKDKIEILYGKFKVKSSKCKYCGNPIIKYEEKMSDVNIAIQLIKAAASKLIDLVFIVSGDTDLYPAIENAKEINSKMKIIVIFPPNRFNNELKVIADGFFILGRSLLRKSLLEEEITIMNGFVIRRPKAWR
jgi:uncharacterized LabA/DUF88 family protein